MIFIIRICKKLEYTDQLRSIYLNNPYLSICFNISIFSLAGFPPFIGFFTKLLLFYSLINSGFYFLPIIAIFTSIITAAYYLNLIILLFFSPSFKFSNSFSPNPYSASFIALLSTFFLFGFFTIDFLDLLFF